MLNQWGIWDTSRQNRPLGLHQNDGLELVLLLRGEVLWQVGAQRHVIRPNSMFFTLPSEVHGGTGQDHSGIELLYAVFLVEEHTVHGKRKLSFPDELELPRSFVTDLTRNLVSSTTHQVAASPLLKNAFCEMVHGLEEGRLQPYRLKVLACTVLEELRFSFHHPMTVKPSHTEETIRAFVRHLKTHCEEDWSLSTMAASCHLKRSQFTELVRDLFGHSPMQLLTRFRVEKAQQLLLQSSDSITDIAFACGFNSSQYFATVFKQIHGVSPSAFQKSKQAG